MDSGDEIQRVAIGSVVASIKEIIVFLEKGVVKWSKLININALEKVNNEILPFQKLCHGCGALYLLILKEIMILNYQIKDFK
ncbi:hypothetical protein [Clostridium sp. FP1]|uniref:hypothetical protein n=1 Tax=Clostridium sp. FP1 TaxID=2724076 RepID=UPI0013E977B5|nr:hypothetical protein [Clostridium sp. FP1]MBZ9635355.1 hypothetical protein [Clostridium sp. FP1]